MGNAEEPMKNAELMESDLLKLKNLRELEAQKKAERDEAIEQLPIVREFEIVRDEREIIERHLRERAILQYKETGDKKFGQIGIRITTKYEFDDVTALCWAKKHDLCLSLDKIAFKKQLKVQPLEFVKVHEVPTATIPTTIKEAKDE